MEDHLEHVGIDGRIILISIFERWDGGARSGSIWFRTGKVGGLQQMWSIK
jgi:hypothetical protein